MTDRGCEMTERVDARTGRTIRQLTDHAVLASRHSYYDICPWSPDGRHIVFSSADPADIGDIGDHSPGTQRGYICVMDTRDFSIRTVAAGAQYMLHVGAFPLWHPQTNTVYYRQTANEIGLVDLDTGRRDTIPGRGRQLSSDGKLFAWPSREGGVFDRAGVYTFAADGSDARCVAPIGRLYELTPNREAFSVDEMSLSNTKWTPNGQHILVASNTPERRDVRRSIFIVSRDGSDARWLTHFAHHHSWTPDGKAVLFNGFKTVHPDGRCEDPRMFLIDFDGSNRRIVIDEPIGSHPIMSPDSEMIVDYDADGVYIVRVADQRIERLAEFRAPFEITHRGTHPHPVWKQDGSAILYNSAETGHSEVYALSLESGS